MRPTVLLADDHPLIAEVLQLLLKDHCDIVGTVRDGPSVVAAAARLRPDVIVVDISMPGFDGFEALRRLRDQGVRSKVIVLTMYGDAGIAQAALALGADGYILKHGAGEELLPAIEHVLRGLIYITPAIAARRSEPA